MRIPCVEGDGIVRAWCVVVGGWQKEKGREGIACVRWSRVSCACSVRVVLCACSVRGVCCVES